MGSVAACVVLMIPSTGAKPLKARRVATVGYLNSERFEKPLRHRDFLPALQFSREGGLTRLGENRTTARSSQKSIAVSLPCQKLLGAWTFSNGIGVTFKADGG
jgi:hypothetical protein